MAASFRNFKNVMTAINYMKKKATTKKFISSRDNAQFDPIINICSERSLRTQRSKNSPQKKGDYIIGKMNINSRVLNPINIHSEEQQQFFTKRMNPKNKKIAK